MRFGTTLLAAIALAGVAHAQPEERMPERPRLRLDESPDLALLSSFRHASEPNRRVVARWRDSRWGSWVRRNLVGLDWEAGYGELFSGGEAPINPNVGIGSGHQCAARLNEAEARWPLVAPREHWFEEDESATWAVEPLSVSPEVMPPWLSRVDAHWAHALVLTAGCGRGGDCSVGEPFPASAFFEVFDALSPEEAPTPWWECRERPLRLFRLNRESEAFVVLHCDGSVPDGALEKLSIMARPVDVARPESLPIEPAADAAEKGEWVPGVRIMHPRLLWVLHRVALAFPWRAVHIYSGYRPADGPIEPGTHSSKHTRGQALDITVQGVEHEELLALCHELPDTGCGYYPNGKFVHFDVRYGGRALWVDASAPGERSRYVDGWPGVVERGRVIWKKPAVEPSGAN